ncbi:MAG TPA: glycosyltransferase [Candidatus Polarisedimenticolia bacterium]|nr:glycosyltransferase [Candidatus Polarisedimenticolia bacterium]
MTARRARVCLVSEVLHPPFDEGIRIYAASLAQALGGLCDLLLLGERRAEVAGRPVHGLLSNRWFLSTELAARLRSFRPQAMVYVPWTSLTSRTLVRAAVLRRYAPRARLGIVALQPRRPDVLSRAAAAMGRPDVVVAAGPGAEGQARRLGLAVVRVPVGVDRDRFRPASEPVRAALRRRGGFSPQDVIVLHVGHMKASRNVQALAPMARLEGVRCLLVTSTSTRGDPVLAESLRAAGVAVVVRHQDRMELVYQMSDVYLFPVRSALDAMEVPLSVLEAAACGLPIVSTRFGGLQDVFGRDEGVVWADGAEEMLEAVRTLAAARRAGPLRAPRAEALGWDRVAARVLEAVLGPGGGPA